MKKIETEKTKKVNWGEFIRAIIQAIIAALTALGVASCAASLR